MRLEEWLAQRMALPKDPSEKEILSKKKELRSQLSEARRHFIYFMDNEEEKAINRLITQLDAKISYDLEEIESKITRSFDRALSRRQ